MTLLIISGSSRKNGNTETLAKEAAAQYNGEVKWIHLREKNVKQIVDERHEEAGFTPVNDDHHDLVEKMLQADVLLFATPVYWYGMSGYMKTFIDRWSQAMRDEDLDFKTRIKNKPSYLIICGGNEISIKGIPLVLQFRHTFEFLSMDFKKYFIGEARRPGDILSDTHQLAQAKRLLE